jgi:hypothetical protein
MTLQRFLILAAACAAASVVGCECVDSLSDRGTDRGDVRAHQSGPATFESDRAPYAVRLPEGWRLEAEGALNDEADLAASKTTGCS